MAAEQTLRQVVGTTPNAEELSLASMGIDDLQPLLPGLARLPRLRRLVLANNALRVLPDDLSCMPALEFLDLSANPVAGLDGVLHGLMSLPRLRHLYIDLPFELDEDSIIVSLQNLESFNGTSLTDGAEEAAAPHSGPPPQPGGFSYGEYPPGRGGLPYGLPPSGHASFSPAYATGGQPGQGGAPDWQQQQSQPPPSAQSHFQPPPQHHPQHQHNPPARAAGPFSVSSSRGGAPSEAPSVDALRTRYGHPGGGAARPGGTSPRALADWGTTDMEEVRQMYNAANQVAGRTASPGEFERYIANVVDHLTTILAGEEDPLAREAEVLKAKQLLFQYCFEEITRNAYNVDLGFANALNVVYRTYTDILERYKELLRTLYDDREQKLAVMRNDMQYAIQEIEHLMQNMEDVRSETVPPEQLLEEWTKEKAGLVEEIGWLRTENERLQARMRQYELTRQKLSTQLKEQSQLQQQELQQLHQRVSRTSPRGMPPVHSTSAQTETSSVYDSGAVLESPHTFITPAMAHSTSTSQAARTSPAARARPVPGRALTLRQLKDIVEDIYNSKSKFDLKCAESHLPRETMEQHLYTYLNQKYGLKNLILDWAESIIAAVRRYTPEDNDIAVFGKILRNEVDEEFRFVQRQLKETVADLLRVYLRGKYPSKTDEDINQILRKRVNGYVNEEEWVDIVKYMYNSDDAMNVIIKVKEAAVDPNQPVKKISARRIETDTRKTAVIRYSDFVKVLLDFQLAGHDRFLSKFVRLFRQYDTDKNGIVNENEFRALLRAIDGSKADEEMNQLLDLIDPHNNQLITFSECVTFLSSELVTLMRDRPSAD